MNKFLVSIIAAAVPLFASSPATAQADMVSPYVSCLAQMHPQQAQALLTAASVDAAQRSYQALAGAGDRCQ